MKISINEFHVCLMFTNATGWPLTLQKAKQLVVFCAVWNRLRNKVALLSCSALCPTVLCFGLSSSYLPLSCVMIRVKYFCTLPTVCVNVRLIILRLKRDWTSTSSELYSCSSFGRFWIQISVRKPAILIGILYT